MSKYLYYCEFETAREAIKLAALSVLEIYKSGDFSPRMKDDNSPVTRADLTANKIIKDVLRKTFPDYGYLSEEDDDDLSRLKKEKVWIIDPLDGTQDFVNRDGEFAINIALAVKNEIVLGLIAIPMKEELYYAFKGVGAYLEKEKEIYRLETSSKTQDLIAVESRTHFSAEDEAYLQKRKQYISEVKYVGSAYKGCLIAAGKADISIKTGEGTKEWDIAPVVLLVAEAGGSFTQPDGTPFSFNKKDVYNRRGYLIVNRVNDAFWTK